MALSFDAEFELEILGESIRNADYAKSALRLCEAHHFGSKERSWVWGVISDTWQKFGEVPTGKLFVNRAREDFPDDTKREPYVALLSKLLKTKPSSPKTALSELEKFVRFVNAQLALEAAADALEKNNIEAAYTAMGKATRMSVGVRKYSLVNWMEEFEERQAARKYEKDHADEITAIQTGFPTLDDITKGVRIGELVLVMGTTGRGKSIALNNIAYRAATMGNNVLLVGFEMPARQIAARQDSRWLGIDYKNLKEYDLTPTELRAIRVRFDKARKHLGERIKIASYPVRSANINDIHSLIDDLKVEYSWAPKVVILDSADHLRALDLKADFRLQQSEVYWSAKALAEEGGYAVFSSTHAGREWAGATATAEAAGESYDKARIADMVVSINDPDYKGKHSGRKARVTTDGDDEEESDTEEFAVPVAREKKMELFLSKYRDGESNRTIPIVVDFHKMLMSETGKKTAE